MFINPICRLGVFEFIFRYTDRFKVENSYLFKGFLIICILDIERVKLIKKRFSELIHLLWIYMLHTLTASEQMTLQVSCILKICIANWTAESLEESLDIVYVTIMTIISYQLNILLILFDASSCKFPNHCAVIEVDVVYENTDTHYMFHRWNIIHAKSLKFWRVRICTVNKKKI